MVMVMQIRQAAECHCGSTNRRDAAIDDGREDATVDECDDAAVDDLLAGISVSHDEHGD